MAERQWAAVLARDARADGTFFYGVKTTGVFCRPSCGSRRPLRKNVVFFQSAGLAREAGFRACKKCRPDAQRPAHTERLIEACRRLEREEGTSTQALADAVSLSPAHFTRAFKAFTGVTPQAYRRRVMTERARTQLATANTVTDAVYAAGFSTSSRFYDALGPELGMSAKKAKQGGVGRAVSYVVRACSLGFVLIAWTDAGVCDVRFDASRTVLEQGLRARFENAQVAQREPPSWVDAIVECVEAPRPLQVPLDIIGTAFQQRVWAALRDIPLGETVTYQALAQRLGQPSATRAVARACATNEVALLIPCHRVIRMGGALAGYRWGLERKRALLEREAAIRAR